MCNYFMGWDGLDIIKLILMLEIVSGASMSPVLMVSGEEIPSNVKAIVADCGYTSVWDEFSYQLDNLFSLPPFPMNVVSS